MEFNEYMAKKIPTTLMFIGGFFIIHLIAFVGVFVGIWFKSLTMVAICAGIVILYYICRHLVNRKVEKLRDQFESESK